jgi:hypothetical protein
MNKDGIIAAINKHDWRDSEFFQRLLDAIPKTEIATFVDKTPAVGAGSPRLNEAPKTMQVRLCRGGLEDSMLTVETVPATLDALQRYMHQHGYPVEPHSMLVVERYCRGEGDARIGWKQVNIVLEVSKGKRWPLGWTDTIPG